MTDNFERDASPPNGTRASRRWRRVPLGLRVLHWVIIVNFVANIVYGTYQVFFALRPEGVSGPLWGAARSIPHELMVARRLYAIEVWICIAGLAVYLAIVEYLPRLMGSRRRRSKQVRDGD